MANNWTKEQLEAITERGCNLLVAAAAGAGKTAVLVERIIRKITDPENPVDIDKLLVVTFTNAAATEMRERIGDALAEALEKDPSSANLQKQMALLDRASIMTIHSFCLEVVRSYFHALDLDPLFRIADEAESALMRLEALDRLFESKYENEDSDSLFFRLVESYGGRDDSLLRDTIMTLHRYTSSHPYPEEWLAGQAEAFRTGEGSSVCATPWARVLLDSAAAELRGLIAMLEKAEELASRAEGLEPYHSVLGQDRKALENLLSLCLDAMKKADGTGSEAEDHMSDDHVTDDGSRSDDIGRCDRGHEDISGENGGGPVFDADLAWDRLHDAFAALEFARLPRCGKNADKTVQEEIKAIRNTVKERLKKLHASGFDITCAEIREDLRKLYPQLKYLSDMVLEFDDIYRRMKKEKGVLDFNDLEHYCLQVLLEKGVPTAAAKELRKRYEEILVDEYQDSNLIQEFILSVVSGNDDGIHNMFMVGDVKQSIYRFRQARPDLFLSKYNAWHRDKGYEDRVIQLYRNFRSRREVINAVNFIFRRIMSPQVGELDYTEQEYLNPGAVFPVPEHPCVTGGPVELHILDLLSEANGMIPDGAGEPGGTAKGAGETEMHQSAEIRLDESGEPNGQTGVTGEPDTAEAGKAGAGVSADGMKANDDAALNNMPGSDTGNTSYASRSRGDGGPEENGAAEEVDEERLDNIQFEARLVGNIIRRIVTHEPAGFNVYDKKTGRYRPAEYRDIVILMRTTMNWADVFVDELALMGIPAYADTGIGYFRTVEVETMLSLLQIIDNPFQDIPMLAVLRSPIGGFSTDDLADIRLADRSASIYEAMLKLAGSDGKTGAHGVAGPAAMPGGVARQAVVAGGVAGPVAVADDMAGPAAMADTGPDAMADGSFGSGNHDVRRKTRDFLARLERWRDAAQYTPVDELVWQLLSETGYYSYVGALPGGARRKANLRMLFERARQYEETSYRGLFNFINFINRLRSGGGDMGSARILGENDNVVRIMSIHKSKGLEFPVVIIAGCGKRFNMQDLNASILLHQDLGFGPDLVDLDKRTITPSLPKFAIRQKLRLETLSEEMRILYVALTRAREKLIITGSVRDHAAALASWREKAAGRTDKLSSYDMMQASSYLDWIGPAVVDHRAAGKSGCEREDGGMDDAGSADEPLLELRFWGTGVARIGKGTPEAAENIREWLQDILGCGDDNDRLPGAEAGSLCRLEEAGYQLRDDEHISRVAANGPGGVEPQEHQAGPAPKVQQENQAAKEYRESAVPEECQEDQASKDYRESAVSEECQENQEPKVCRENPEQAEVRHIIEALEWVYPYRKLTTVPAKISVTELKRRALLEEAPESAVPYMQPMQERPLFLEPDKGLSAAHRGTVMHFVMQHLDLGKLFEVTQRAGDPGSGSDIDLACELVREISSQVASMTERELLTPAEAESVDPDAVAEFFMSPFGKRMLSMHDSVHRETAFTIEIKCSEVLKPEPVPGLQQELRSEHKSGSLSELQPELYSELRLKLQPDPLSEFLAGPQPDSRADLQEVTDCDETMLLQGVIDCWFETENGLVLLDYKTDYVPEGRSDIIKERYRVQIDYYTKALERITGKKVTERYLYLFYSGELIEC